MTRFMKEHSGELGAYWKDQAEKELADIKTELDAGQITIGDNGVARNRAGRVVMADVLEKIALVTDKVDVAATAAARDAEVAKALMEYRAAKQAPCAEEMAEMRSSFAAGTVVVNVITGEEIRL